MIAAALVLDLKQRGLLEDTLVTFKGEFVQVEDIEIDIVHGDRSPKDVPIYIGATGMQMIAGAVLSLANVLNLDSEDDRKPVSFTFTPDQTGRFVYTVGEDRKVFFVHHDPTKHRGWPIAIDREVCAARNLARTLRRHQNQVEPVRDLVDAIFDRNARHGPLRNLQVERKSAR